MVARKTLPIGGAVGGIAPGAHPEFAAQQQEQEQVEEQWRQERLAEAAENYRQEARERMDAAMARQLAQSAFRVYGGGPSLDDFAVTDPRQVQFRAGTSKVPDTTAQMQAEGISPLEIRTILRQHEADLGNVTADGSLNAIQAEQVMFVASSTRREVNAWERGEVAAGRLAQNPHLPSHEADLLDEQVELETLREGLSVASGIQFVDPATVSFDVPGYDASGQLESAQAGAEAGRESSDVMTAAGQGFARGALGQLGPKARARLEKHPELAEGMGSRNPAERLAERTAHIKEPEPQAEEDLGWGRLR